MSKSQRQCSIQIPLAIADEAASIAWVLHQAFSEYESLYTAAAFAITTPTPAEIKQRWNEGPVWSALKNGRLVGTVAAVAKGDALYIRSMAVVPSARGQGIGKILLAEVESFATAGELVESCGREESAVADDHDLIDGLGDFGEDVA